MPARDLGDHLEVPHVELGDPAVARGEEHVAPLGRELGPAMQGEARLEAEDRLELVAVEHAHVMIARLHDQEEVERVGVEHRLVGERGRVDMHDARGADVLVGPARRGFDRRVDPVGDGGDLAGAEHLAEGGHLRGGAPLRDDLHRFGLAQAGEVVGQQRRAHAAEAVGRVAFGAMLGIERDHVLQRQRGGFACSRSRGLGRRARRHHDREGRAHGFQGGAKLHAETLLMRVQGVVTTRSAP